ncbi:hypothetical protein QR680_007106 [Steinernema hermaphroditum]|uniref:Uncharacterized protein n=1 Tax=Steinernema hermaphroditum TaxID=289476 RepID=A0AA39I019_9BILA|nr:hypothetical protein QR680_007106 [Steinernema hermaphroditum]
MSRAVFLLLLMDRNAKNSSQGPAYPVDVKPSLFARDSCGFQLAPPFRALSQQQEYNRSPSVNRPTMIINVCASSVSSHEAPSYYYMSPYFYPSLLVETEQTPVVEKNAPLAEVETEFEVVKKQRKPLQMVAVWLRKCVRAKKDKKRRQ